MKKRKQWDYRLLLLMGLVVLVIGLAFFRIPEVKSRSGSYVVQSAQPALPVFSRQGDVRVGQPRESNTLLLYPNPVEHTLHVVVPRKYATYVWLTIHQANGQLWRKYEVEAGRVIQINVRSLPRGEYLLKVADRERRTWSAKFFKA